MISGTELMLAISLLGAMDGFVERDFQVIVVSAEADQINRIHIEKRFPNATFFYAAEDTPTTGMSPYGQFSLLNEADDEPTLAAQFQVAGTVHSVTIPADKFLESLHEAHPALDTGLFLANPVGGQAVATVALEKLDKDSLAPATYYLMPRVPKEGATPPAYTYPTALKSVAVYLRTKSEADKMFEQWSPGYVGPNRPRPSEQSWAVGAEAFAQHYSSSSLSISITERLRKAKEETIPVGDYAVVSHVLQESGAIVLPNVRNQRAALAGEKTPPLYIPKVLKTDGKITGFSVDAQDFINSAVRPHLEGVPSEAQLLCHLNKQKPGDWACVEDAGFPSGHAIRFTQGGATPVNVPFYLVQADTSRRWRVDLSFNQAPPGVSDPTIFPITLPEAK